MPKPNPDDFFSSPATTSSRKSKPDPDAYFGAPTPPPAPEPPGLMDRVKSALMERGEESAAPPVATGRDTTAGDVAEAIGGTIAGTAGLAAEKALGTMLDLQNSEGREPEPSPVESPLSAPAAYPLTRTELLAGQSLRPEVAQRIERDARPPAEARPFTTGQNMAADVREVTKNPVARGVAQGLGTIGKVGPGALRIAADFLGSEGMADLAKASGRAAEEFSGGVTSDLKGNDKLVAQITGSIVNSAPSMALGVVGGPALKTLFAQSALSEYNAGRDAGFSPEESAKRSGIIAFAEALGERAGFPQQIALLKSLSKHVPTDRLSKVFGEMLAKEIPGEQLTTAMQFLADKVGPAALHPDATLADYLDQAGETLKVTIGQTAVMGGGPATIGAARNALRKADAGVTPAEPDPAAILSQAIDEAAREYGLSPKATAAMRDKANTMPPQQAAGFVERALTEFERGNLVRKPGAAAGFKQTLNDLAEQAQAEAEAQPAEPEAAPAPEAAPEQPRFDAAAMLEGDDFSGLDTPAQAGPATTAPASAVDFGSQDEVADVTIPSSGAQAVVPAPPIEGEAINRNWSTFAPESGTLNIPREQMPQIKAEHRGALVNFMNARGIEHQSEEVPADSLKPTQGEFSPRKVKQAIDFTGGDRAILVSQDGFVMDGHHQWLAKRESGEPVRVIRLQAPIQDLLRLAHQFPSSTTAKGPRDAGNGNRHAEPAGSAGRGPADADASRGTEPLVQGELQQPVPAGTAGPAVPDPGQRDVPEPTRPGDGHDALTAGAAVELDGKAYTIKAKSPKVIRLTGEDGKVRAISSDSANWPKIKPASAARPTPVAEEFAGQRGEGMSEFVAKSQRQRLAKERPDLEWTVAEADTTRNPKLKADRYVVQGRPLQPQAPAAEAGAQAGGVEPAGATGADGVAAAGSASVEADGVKAQPDRKPPTTATSKAPKAKKAKDAEQARLKKADDEREVRARADKTVDDFELGKSADDQLSGQEPLLSRSSTPFYSELSRRIEDGPMNQGTAAAWGQLLKGMTASGKIKADEVEWSGLREWLELQPGKVTKQQIAEYLKANGVQVTETVLGAAMPLPEVHKRYIAAMRGQGATEREAGDYWEAMRMFASDQYGYNAEDREAGFKLVMADGSLTGNEIHDVYGEHRSSSAKYGQYTLPGGTNYREVLLTLPVPEGEKNKALREFQRELIAKYGGINYRDKLTLDEAGTLGRLQGEEKLERKKQDTSYKSGHWDQPNILAHIRVNDRVDADGKRVLFVEEVQSDWGQAKKKSGFREENERLLEELISKRDAAKTDAEGEEFQRQINELARRDPGVPRAPFVENTDKWLALALKRIVKMAADEGYDRVAFVNGEQSAERYDLSKQVDHITYEKTPKGYFVNVMANGRNMLAKDLTTTEVEDTLGKEVLAKMERSEGKDEGARDPDLKGSYTLSGAGLKVGGEGMRAFYDRIVPAAAKDVLKKLGGQVGRVKVRHEVLDYQRTAEYVGPIPTDKQVAELYELSKRNGPDIKRNPITGLDEPFAINRVTVEGQLRKLTSRLSDGMPFDVAIVSPDISEYTATMFGGSIERTTAQPDVLEHVGFDITAAMRAKVTGGVPLFKRGTTRRGMPLAEAQETVRQLEAVGVRKIHVVDTVADMPADRRDAILAKDENGEARGAYFPAQDEVWLVASNLRDSGELVFVALHEAFHRGLQVTFGAEGAKLLRQIYATNKRIRDLADGYMTRYKIGKEEAVNEALADLAGSGEVRDIRGWHRLLKMIRDWLGKIADALGISLKFTDAMVDDLIMGLTRAGLQDQPAVNVDTAGPAREATKQAIFEQVQAGKSFAEATAEVQASRNPERAALEALAEDDAMFTLPKSQAKSVEDIVAETAPLVKVRKVDLPNRETMWTLTMPNGSLARITQRPADTYGPPVYGYESDGVSFTPVLERPGDNAEAVPETKGDVWIDVSQLKEGGDGRLVYNIAATYAHNTDRIFIGDPNGLSDIALRRRAQHMLSSALKFGTTDHLAPAMEQVRGSKKAGVPPLQWTYGDSAGNIRSLINVVLGGIESAGGNPIDFRPDTGRFYDRAGRELDDDSLRQAVEAGRSPAARAGDTTLKGLAVLRALVREEGGPVGSAVGRPVALLERLLALRGEYPVSTKGILYSRSGDQPLLSRAGNTVAADDAEAKAVRKGYKARVNAALDRVDRTINGLGGLPDTEQFLAQRYRALGKIAAIDKVAGQIRSTFRKATKDEKKAIYDYLTTAGATPDAISTAEVRQMAVDTKAYINTVGDQLVKRGLLPEESREEYRDRYLPRLYLAHLLDEGDWRSMGAGKKVSNLSYLKARKDIPQEVREVLLGEVKDPAFLAATAVAKPMRDMALLDWLDQISQNAKWILPGTMTEWKGKRVSAFWLKAEAQALRDRARHYPEQVNAEKARAIADEMETAADAALGDADLTDKDYKQIPNAARYGRLRGLMVRSEIYDDLMGTQDFMPRDPGWVEKTLGYGGLATKATQLWKMSKVALNPPGQVRNAISNAVMLNLSGVPLHRFPLLAARAIKQIRHGGKHWKIAQKYGVTESTFQAQEMFRARRDLLDLERDLKGMTPMVAIKSVGAAIADFAGDAYQATEAVFKTLKIMDAMERQGLTEEAAALEAQKWLFDYSLLNRNIRYARNAPIGAPFATFTAKVLPRLAEVALLHPWRFLPWVALMYGMQAWVQAVFGGDDDEWEQLEKALPQWMQDKGHIAFLPWRDDAGRLQAVDLSYFFPWSQWSEFATKAIKADALGAIKSLGLFGGPVTEIAAAIKTNEDSFTGRDIVNPDDPASERAASLLAYTWDMAMPPFMTSNGVVSPLWLVGPEYGGKLAQATTGATNKMGDQKSTFGQAASRMVGFNAYGIDPELTRAQNMLAMKYGMDRMVKRLESKLQNQGLTEEQKERLTKTYSEAIAERMKEYQEYEKEAVVPEFAKVKKPTAQPVPAD